MGPPQHRRRDDQGQAGRRHLQPARITQVAWWTTLFANGFEAHLARLTETYAGRLAATTAALRREFAGTGLRLASARGRLLHVDHAARTNSGPSSCSRSRSTRGFTFVPGGAFSATGQFQRSQLRLCFVAVPEPQLIEGVARGCAPWLRQVARGQTDDLRRLGVYPRFAGAPDGTPLVDIGLGALSNDPGIEWRFLPARTVPGWRLWMFCAGFDAGIRDGRAGPRRHRRRARPAHSDVARLGVGLDGVDVESCTRVRHTRHEHARRRAPPGGVGCGRRWSSHSVTAS